MATSGGLSDDWTFRRYQPEDVEAFVAASDADADAAWDAIIERLLARPRDDERWGQHGLDVTRYADTGGMSSDFERSSMWRYRDYVIRALNSDKPYDRFVVEQIAGDEPADESVRERTDGSEADVHRVQQSGENLEHEAEWIVATGFLRLGPWDHAMVEQHEARQMRMLDFAVAEKTRLVEKREAAARSWFEEHGLPYQDDDARKSLPDEEKPPRHVGLDHVEQGQLKVRERDEWIWTRRQRQPQTTECSRTFHG